MTSVTSPMAFQAPDRAHHPADAYHVAWQLLEDRSPGAAIEVLDPALDKEPDSASLRTLRAWAYLQRAQLTRAQADLLVLVEECSTHVCASFALGRVRDRQSKSASAPPHCRLVTLCPGDAYDEDGVLRV